MLLTLASAAALVASVSAASSATAFNLNSTCIESQPKARVVNRCSYPVYLWSVVKGDSCPENGGAVLQPGEFYQENFRPAVGGTGTSIKVSKTQTCEDTHLLQLEYYIETNSPGFNYNYLDVSYVNCQAKDCPSAAEGFYLKSGNADGKFARNDANTICPIISCGTWDDCAKMSYVLPDDERTKSCDPQADLDFYMCGSEAPGAESPKAQPSSAHESDDKKPASTKSASSYSEENQVAAAEVTPAPAASTKAHHIKTEVVYVTEYAYVNAKRHAHGHRHQHFHA